MGACIETYNSKCYCKCYTGYSGEYCKNAGKSKLEYFFLNLNLFIYNYIWNKEDYSWVYYSSGAFLFLSIILVLFVKSYRQRKNNNQNQNRIVLNGTVYSVRNNRLEFESTTGQSNIATIGRQISMSESLYSYEDALRNSAIIVQENNSAPREFNLPTYDDYTKKLESHNSKFFQN